MASIGSRPGNWETGRCALRCIPVLVSGARSAGLEFRDGAFAGTWGEVGARAGGQAMGRNQRPFGRSGWDAGHAV